MQAPNFISQTQYRNSCPRGPAHSMLRSLRLDRLTGKLTYKVLRELGHRQTRQTPIELRTFVTNEVRDLIEQDREGTRGYPSSAATRGRSSIGTRGIRSIIEKARCKFPEECGSPIQDDLFHSPNAGLHPPDVTTHDDPPSNSDATAAKNISRTRNGGSHSRISLPNLSQAALDRPRAATCSPTSFISDSGASEEGRYPVARIMRANRLVCDEPWSKKIDEDLQKLKQETALQRDQELEKRRQQRQLLDQQVTQRRQALIEEREAKRQYAREQERLNKLWEDEQHRIQEEKFRQERANKAQRESLLEAKRQQDREREQKEKIEGRAWALKLSEEAQQEEIARRNKKKEHAKLFREFIQENNRLADQRKQEALLEKQKEKEILKRFTKVLEEQEKKGALEKALASKRAQLVLMKQTSIAETMRKAEEQRRREEESHERHIEELLRRREAEEYEREMNRQQRREKARQEFVVALEDQLHEKEAQKQREVEEQQRLREQADEEVKAWHVWQREQQKKSKERKLQQLEALERQTHENEIKARCPIPIKVWENPLCRQGTAPSRNEPHSLGGASLNTSLVS